MSPLKSAAIVSSVSGLGAAALLFFAVHNWVVAVGFLAAAFLAFGILATWRLLRPATEQTRRTIDWDFTRVVADASA
ncbi:hypothetical protein, partial [Sphingomonas paucimobilis]|uniref:hypothetical protein n=1 Tax=Sphingomonas paucimobilis TaxID=13689 RepID=UPI002432FE02